MIEALEVFMGWDPREELAYEVAASSMRRHTRVTHSISPVRLGHLNDILTRPIEVRDGRMWCPISQAPMATEFAISRFAVPFLKKDGWALFVDCDVLLTAGLEEIFALADPKYALMVVQHPALNAQAEIKMDGQLQTFYRRKNWSSVMLWNCGHPANKELTRERLNTWPGRDLHAFRWLPDELIGALPAAWNHLVDVQPRPPQTPKLLHYTLGGPWFEAYRNCGYAEEWVSELRRMNPAAVS